MSKFEDLFLGGAKLILRQGKKESFPSNCFFKQNRISLSLDLRRYLVLVSLSLLFLSCGRKKDHAPQGKILARVGDEVLTEGDLKLLLPDSSLLSDKKSKSFIDEWVRNTLFYLAAKSDGLDRDSGVLRRLKWTKKVTLAEEYWAHEIAKLNVPKESVDSLWKAKNYLFGSSVNLILVFFEDPLRGDHIRKRLRDSRRYKRYLRYLTTDPTVNVQRTGWINIGYLFYEYKALPEGAESLVLNMKKGDVSPVIAFNGSYFVFKILGKKEEKVDSIEVKNILTQILVDKKRRNLEDSLENNLKKSFPIWTGGLTQ